MRHKAHRAKAHRRRVRDTMIEVDMLRAMGMIMTGEYRDLPEEPRMLLFASVAQGLEQWIADLPAELRAELAGGLEFLRDPDEIVGALRALHEVGLFGLQDGRMYVVGMPAGTPWGPSR